MVVGLWEYKTTFPSFLSLKHLSIECTVAFWAFTIYQPGLIVPEEENETSQPREPGMSLEEERCCLAPGAAEASSVACLLLWARLQWKELAFC